MSKVLGIAIGVGLGGAIFAAISVAFGWPIVTAGEIGNAMMWAACGAWCMRELR